MILRKIVVERIKCMKSYNFLKKRKHIELIKIFPFFELERCTYCTKTSFTTQLFDTVEVQKYLKYIVNEKSHPNYDRVVQLLDTKKNIETEMQALEKMSSEGNKELENLIEIEKNQYLNSIEVVKNDIILSIMPNIDENNDRNVELQILPGIGGEESKNFSSELYQMYINYSEYKNWTCSLDLDKGYIFISGKFVYGHLKCEAGVHRVQRVPETEKSGRTHTSTCSVVVLPQPKDHEIIISQKDIIIDKMRSGGPGGQNVNKRETCVRVTHIPTGTVIECQNSRYQFENIKIAINKLRTILFNNEQQKITAERNTMKKEQAGTNDYSDKIRTYNYPQSRVTDHRINYTTQNLKGFLSGNRELDHVISQVQALNMKNEFICHINNTLQSVNYKNFEAQQS